MRIHPTIGAAHRHAPIRSRTARTVAEAFGPYARLDTPAGVDWDRVIGRACGVILCLALGALAASRWGVL